MATRIAIALEDDLDGGPADVTLRFGLGGSEYELDLSAKNASRFRQQLAPFIEHARKAGPGQRHRSARPSSARQRGSEIRAWAKDQGIAVRNRGRIPSSVADLYDAAAGNRRLPARSRSRPALRSSSQIAGLAVRTDQAHQPV